MPNSAQSCLTHSSFHVLLLPRGDGFAEAKRHTFFKGLDWNKMEAGVIKPPLQPSKDKISAQLPSSLKDEFTEYERMDVPADTPDKYSEWNLTCRHFLN